MEVFQTVRNVGKRYLYLLLTAFILIFLLAGMSVFDVHADETIDQQVNEAVASIVAQCKASGATGDYAIAKWLHDYLIYNADYDITYTNYGAEGVLLYQSGVCQSYTEAYSLLLNEFGIENLQVVSDSMDHSWNMVKINGTWTHVDCTWDDPIDENNIPGGNENSFYFAVGDDFIGVDHQWVRSDYPAGSNVLPAASDETQAAGNLTAEKILRGINFKVKTSDGKTITPKSFTDGNVLLIEGRPTCGNTMAFVRALSKWKDTIKLYNLHVIVIFESEEQVKSYASTIPFTCGYMQDDTYDSWRFLSDMGIDGSYMLPLICLQSADQHAFYYSTGYVEDPDQVIAFAVKTSITPLADAGHRKVTDKAVAATCTTPGKTVGSHCSICGEVLTVQKTVPATGHKSVIDPAVAATCTTAGKTAGSHCSVCKEVLTAQETLPALGHTIVKDAAAAATVFKAGKTAGTHCSVCGKVIKVQKKVAKLKPTIKLSAAKKTIKVKKSFTLTISKLANGDSVKSVKSASTKIAKVKKISNKKYRITGVKKGKVKITVTLKSGKKAACTVIVKK